MTASLEDEDNDEDFTYLVQRGEDVPQVDTVCVSVCVCRMSICIILMLPVTMQLTLKTKQKNIYCYPSELFVQIIQKSLDIFLRY